jgi:hypothetical protein
MPAICYLDGYSSILRLSGVDEAWVERRIRADIERRIQQIPHPTFDYVQDDESASTRT